MTKSRLLSLEELQQVSLSAICAKQYGAGFYELDTGLGRKAKYFLKERWGITDTNSAKQIISELLLGDCSRYFPIICEAFLETTNLLNQVFFDGHMDTNHTFSELRKLHRDGDTFERLSDNQKHMFNTWQRKSFESIQHRVSEIGKDTNDIYRTHRYFLSLIAEYDDLIEEGVIQNYIEMQKLGVKAWDLGRAVFLARLCHERNLISEADTWRYIKIAYEIATNDYGMWDDYAKSYIVGSAIWNDGTEEYDIEELFQLYQWLCKSPTSPWLKIPLR